MTKILEMELVEEIARDVGICTERAYVLMHIPVHPEKKILSLHPCYSNCTDKCPKHPNYGAV